MTEIATPEYARALLAVCAGRMREAIAAVSRYESDTIMHHRLAEVSAECEWCEREYGEDYK